MIRTIIIDDEPLARLVIREHLSAHADIEIVDECENGFEGIKSISRLKPDLIYLDIQMPKINGFEMLELIEQTPAVIFVTAFDEYAIKAFEANAIDYLLKPFSAERFDRALQKCRETLLEQKQAVNPALLETPGLFRQQQERIVIRNGSTIKIIPVSEVIYLEAADDYVKVHTPGGCFLKNRTMQYFEQTLSPLQFIRTHRSYIANSSYITKIEQAEKDQHIVILLNGQKVPVSKSGYLKIKQVLGI